MKITIKVPKEIEITHILIDVPVEYGDEEIPLDFPLRQVGHIRDRWSATINIDTGKIENWPSDAGARELFLTVRDAGTYTLLGKSEGFNCILEHAKISEDYVPNRLIPGEYGDTIRLKIAADGTITNWHKKPDVSAFFGNED